MRVLFVNHTSNVSGAERSLIASIAVARRRAEVTLACPPGALMERVEAMGVDTIVLAAPQIGFSSGSRALVRAALGYARTGTRLRRLAHDGRFDCVHASSSRAGLLAAWCLFSRTRRVTDVRDALPAGVRAAVVRLVLRLTSHVIVFNSEFTSARFGSSWPARSLVLYPSIDLDQFLGLPLPADKRGDGYLTLGIVGQITPWKGQDDAIRILELVRRRVPGTRLRIVGTVVFRGDDVSLDNTEFDRRLRELALELGI